MAVQDASQKMATTYWKAGPSIHDTRLLLRQEMRQRTRMPSRRICFRWTPRPTLIRHQTGRHLCLVECTRQGLGPGIRERTWKETRSKRPRWTVQDLPRTQLRRTLRSEMSTKEMAADVAAQCHIPCLRNPAGRKTTHLE